MAIFIGSMVAAVAHADWNAPQHDEWRAPQNRACCDASTAMKQVVPIDVRQAHQREQIRFGLRSGEISHHEARRLRHEQRQIERMQQRFMADGHLDRQEREILAWQMRQAAKHIQFASNDRDGRR